MKSKKILPLTALAVLLFAMAPVVQASTLTVNLNPKSGLAKVDLVSTTKITFTYPAGSQVSNYLKNVSSNLNLKGTYNGGSSGVEDLQQSFDDEGSHISVTNMTVAISYSAKGSDTTLVINKMTNVTAWVKGVFHIVNGTVQADLGWRSLVVHGAWNLDMEDHNIDVNLVGSTTQYSLGDHPYAAEFLSNAFGEGSIWSRPTLNYSALNTPLSTWTKNYDSTTNTTTFSKTISGQTTFSASIDNNGQTYSLSATSDPSGVVSVQGYANASGDSLVIAPAPSSGLAGMVGLGAAIVVLVVVAGLVFGARRLRPISASKPSV